MDIRINPLDYENLKCPKCGSIVWARGFLLKKISGIEIGAGTQDQLLDLPVYYCAECGEIFPDDREMYKLDQPSKKADNEEKKTTSPLILDI